MKQKAQITTVDGLYSLYTPTRTLRSNSVVIDQRIRRIKPLLKDMQVGQAFALERSASAWARGWLAKHEPSKRFVVSVPKDKRLPAEVRLISARTIKRGRPSKKLS
jgi:hypothetical protein